MERKEQRGVHQKEGWVGRGEGEGGGEDAGGGVSSVVTRVQRSV